MNENVIGIDLGTTYSCAAVYRFDRQIAEVLRNRHGQTLTPSVVWFGTGSVEVGQTAKDRQLARDPDVMSLGKREMGNPLYQPAFGGAPRTSEEFSTKILEVISVDAGIALGLGGPVRKAVITVPAYFWEPQWAATLSAAKAAGLEVPLIINEPEAAALAFVASGTTRGNTPAAGTYLVFDLGGGTFDVAVVRVTPGARWRIEALAYDGDSYLGGREFDAVITRHVQAAAKRLGAELFESGAQSEWAVRAEQIKIQLSTAESVDIPFTTAAVPRGTVTLTRREFEQGCETLVQRTLDASKRALDDAMLSWSDLAGVLLVGGSTRMPMISAALTKLTGRSPRSDLHPDEAVALGAAVAAAGIAGHGPLVDFAPVSAHALGVILQSADGKRWVNVPVLSRNSPIGHCGSRTFKASLRPDGSGVLNIYVTQGDVRDPTDPRCRILYQFKATGLPAGVGTIRVETTYEYTVDRIIKVTARVADGGSELLVTPERLTDVERFHSPPPPPDPVTVVLALDASGSMAGEGRFETVRRAASQCLAALTVPGSRVGVLMYSHDVSEVCPLTDDSDVLRRALEAAQPTTYGTRFMPPLRKAREILESLGGKRVVVLLTDGEPQGNDSDSQKDAANAFAEANHSRSSGIEVRTVGTGEATLDFLNKIGPGVIAQGIHLEQAFLAVMSDIGTDDDRADDTGSGDSMLNSRIPSAPTVPVVNLFLALGCSPGTSDSELPQLLDEANSRWSNRFTDVDGLYYSALSARYNYFLRIIKDPHALAREREEARKSATAAEAAKRLRVDELVKAAARKDGCVTEAELADFARDTGVPLVEVRAIVGAHGATVVPDEKEPDFPELPLAQAQNLADHLGNGTNLTLYAVVGGTPETSPDNLVQMARKMYEMAGGESGTDRLRTHLVAEAIRIFPDPVLRIQYENTRLLNQLEGFRKEIQVMAGSLKVLEVEDQEALLGQMAAAAKPVAYRGADQKVGKVILMRTAAEHGIRLPKGKGHTLTPKVRCLECGQLNPEGSVRCGVCDHDLYPKCPQCHEKNLNGTAQCKKCQFELRRKPEADALANEALQILEFGDDPAKADKLAEDALKLWLGHSVADEVRRRVREGRNSATAALDQARSHQDARRHRAALEELKKVTTGPERTALEETSRRAVAAATAKIDAADAIRDRDPDAAFDLYHEANDLCIDSGSADRIATCPPAAVGEVRGEILRGTLQLTWLPSPSAIRDAQIEYRVELITLNSQTGVDTAKTPIVANTRDTRTGTPLVGGVPVAVDVTALRRGIPGMSVRGGPFLLAARVENARGKFDKGMVRLTFKAPATTDRVTVTRKSASGETEVRGASSTAAYDRDPPQGETLMYRVVASYRLPDGTRIDSEPAEVMVIVPGNVPSLPTPPPSSPPPIDGAPLDEPVLSNMVPPVARDPGRPITDLTVEVKSDGHGAYEVIAKFTSPAGSSPEVYASDSPPPVGREETVPIDELTRFGEAMAIVSASEARLQWSAPTLFITPVTVTGTVAVVGWPAIVVLPQACRMFITKPGSEIRIEVPWPAGIDSATARVTYNPNDASSKAIEVQLTREKTIGWAVHSFPRMTPTADVVPLATVFVGSDRFENAAPVRYKIPLADRRTLYYRLVVERENDWSPWVRLAHQLLRQPKGRVLRVRVWVVPDRMTDRMPSLELRYFPNGRPLDREEGAKLKDLYSASSKGTESFGPDRPFTDVYIADSPLEPDSGFRVFATNPDEAIGWRFIDTSNCF